MYCLKLNTAVTIRDIYPQDAFLLRDMYRHCSAESIYNRHFQPYTPSMDELSHLCSMPPSEGKAFVAVSNDAWSVIVGMGYYMISDTEPQLIAEPAILVEDEFHGQGIGSELFQRLLQDARRRGVVIMRANLLDENVAPMKLIRHSGYHYDLSVSQGMREADIYLQRPKLSPQ